MNIKLNQIPMPPSVNQTYNSRLIKGRLIRTRSKQYNDFKRIFAAWSNANGPALALARESLDGYEGPLRLTAWFYFPENKLFTKSGAIKRLDVSNRLKPIEDLISNELGIDDRQFFEIYLFKVQSANACVSMSIEKLD